MVNAIKLYGRYVAISLRGQMQYRASFVMLTIGHFLVTGMEIVAVWAGRYLGDEPGSDEATNRDAL